MIQLLYTVIVAEMVLILTLLFKTPLRKLVILGLDRVKQGRGPIVVTTIGSTIFVVFLSSVSSIVTIRGQTEETGGVPNPTEAVLMAWNLLEASLMGFLLFLGLMIDRLHHYIRELRLLRKTMEATKKQNQDHEDKKNRTSEEAKALQEEISSLRSKISKVESELEAKTNQARAAEAESEALRKQSEGFLLEYDRLLADNQNLRNQLGSIDETLSHSEVKKNT